MRRYETIVILKADLPDAQVTAFQKKIEKVLSAKPGEIFKKDDWGTKKLAYEITKQKKGRYLFWAYQQTPDAIRNLDRNVRFDENILRFMTVVAEERKPSPAVKPGKKAEVMPEAVDIDGDDRKKGQSRRRGLHFFTDSGATVDYKDVNTLAQFITERGKIVPMRNSGMNAFQQRALAKAIKRARQVALLSYTEGFYTSSHEVEATP